MKRTVALIALAAVVSHTLARTAFPILLPAIEDELLANHTQAGLLTTVNFASYLAGVAVVTAVSGRMEPIRLLQTGLASAIAGFVLLATAHGFTQLALGQAMTGIGSAGIWMSAPVLATSVVPGNRRGTVMGLLSSAMGLGIFIVSQGTNAMRLARDDDQTWRPTWVAAAIFALVVLVVIVGLIQTPPTARITGGVSLARLRTVPRSGALIVGFWVFGLIVASFTPFLGAALEEKGFSRTHVGNLYSLFGLAAAVGAVSLGRVSDRIGRQPVLLGAMGAISAAALLVVAGREPFATMAAVMYGIASFTFPVMIAAYLSDHLQDRAFSNALGALTLIYGTAMAAGPYISGIIGDSRFGFDVVFVGVAVLALIGAAAVFQLPREPGAASVVVAGSGGGGTADYGGNGPEHHGPAGQLDEGEGLVVDEPGGPDGDDIHRQQV
ncbi:MAG: YbfB/YjiJ family MFS transporter [Actinomycetia bacterium]|nr:YbfB/YjiJ family MFS transporter [Actinomycetes bacterium]